MHTPVPAYIKEGRIYMSKNYPFSVKLDKIIYYSVAGQSLAIYDGQHSRWVKENVVYLMPKHEEIFAIN